MKLNVNTASLKELEDLPGIGKVTAKRILEYIDEKGSIKEIEELRSIKGISATAFRKFEHLIEVKNERKGILVSIKDFIVQTIEDNVETIKVEDFKKESINTTAYRLPTIKLLKRKKLDIDEIYAVSKKYEIEAAVIQSVIKIESSGSGFLKSGKPKILFEGHIFYKELKKVKVDFSKFMKANPSIVYKNWTRKHYKGGSAEYSRLEKAIELHPEAALKSASWGLFQVMGFNYSNSHDSVFDFVESMYQSENEHLKVFFAFIEKNNLTKALQKKDWDKFALKYNGPSYQENRYAERLAASYKRFKSQEFH